MVTLELITHHANKDFHTLLNSIGIKTVSRYSFYSKQRATGKISALKEYLEINDNALEINAGNNNIIINNISQIDSQKAEEKNQSFQNLLDIFLFKLALANDSKDKFIDTWKETCISALQPNNSNAIHDDELFLALKNSNQSIKLKALALSFIFKNKAQAFTPSFFNYKNFINLLSSTTIKLDSQSTQDIKSIKLTNNNQIDFGANVFIRLATLNESRYIAAYFVDELAIKEGLQAELQSKYYTQAAIIYSNLDQIKKATDIYTKNLQQPVKAVKLYLCKTQEQITKHQYTQALNSNNAANQLIKKHKLTDQADLNQIKNNYTQIIDLGSKQQLNFQQIGDIYINQLNDLENAAKYYAFAGKNSIKNNNLNKALKLNQQAEKLNPTIQNTINAITYNYEAISKSFYEQKQYQLAITAYEETVWCNPQLMSEADFEQKNNKQYGELAIDENNKMLLVYGNNGIERYTTSKDLDFLISDLKNNKLIQRDRLSALFDGYTQTVYKLNVPTNLLINCYQHSANILVTQAIKYNAVDNNDKFMQAIKYLNAAYDMTITDSLGYKEKQERLKDIQQSYNIVLNCNLFNSNSNNYCIMAEIYNKLENYELEIGYYRLAAESANLLEQINLYSKCINLEKHYQLELLTSAQYKNAITAFMLDQNPQSKSFILAIKTAIRLNDIDFTKQIIIEAIWNYIKLVNQFKNFYQAPKELFCKNLQKFSSYATTYLQPEKYNQLIKKIGELYYLNLTDSRIHLEALIDLIQKTANTSFELITDLMRLLLKSYQKKSDYDMLATTYIKLAKLADKLENIEPAEDKIISYYIPAANAWILSNQLEKLQELFNYKILPQCSDFIKDNFEQIETIKNLITTHSSLLTQIKNDQPDIKKTVDTLVDNLKECWLTCCTQYSQVTNDRSLEDQVRKVLFPE